MMGGGINFQAKMRVEQVKLQLNNLIDRFGVKAVAYQFATH